ncbi:helix-turn-helix transcriptional regulator [Sphingobacterium corticibacterium]|uniref:Diguanylate cyclase n=1 Tax=Sphingobacterium corticibacterium TaxID=2484746 RepID=A0A4Q6XVF5_9SPHI|nr:diguanylate cyclase [Sphingobacterium corticibacterium]RZF61662.1 diguanylate cyclase [Sphingobacterium corticibacterium]
MSLFKPFWHVISNRHIEKDMDKLLIVKIQLMNQYAFLIALIFILDAIRNLSVGKPVNFIVLASLGSLLFTLSWYTKIYFNAKIAILTLMGVTCAVFYSCSIAGFHNGIAPYYFTVLFATLFIFNEHNKLYNLFVFLWVFVLFYVVQLFDLTWFSELYSQIYFHENPQATLVQAVFLLVINGYFIMLKNNEMQKLYHQAKYNSIRPSNPSVKLSSNIALPSVEDVVKLAQEGDPAFIATFQQVFPSFYANLFQQNPDMTQEEFKFCALLKLGFTTKDIANYNHLAIRTVQTRKSRLRKSFRVPPQEDLYIWIAQF